MIKSMMQFKGLIEFNRFTDFLVVENWTIEKQLLKDRVQVYKEHTKYQFMKKEFYRNEISIWPLKEEEIITWLDTLLLLRRVLNNIKNQGFDLEQLMIFMEYPLVYGNHMRSDYIFAYNRLIIVLEFGMFNQDEKRSEERYTKKLQESISYRQILSNLIDQSISVVNYVMIYKPEHNRETKTNIQENITYNYKEIDALSRFIIGHIEKQYKYNALNQLFLIEKSR
jgi:hypothetical protein